MIREDFNLLPLIQSEVEKVWAKYCDNCINKKLTKNFKGISGETIEESFDINKSPEGSGYWKDIQKIIESSKKRVLIEKYKHSLFKAGESKSECVGDASNVVGTAVNPHEHTYIPTYQNPEGRHGALPDKKHHLLKLHEKWWDRVMSGQKSFEIRVNDRDFQTGDTICFRKVSDEPDLVESSFKTPESWPENEFKITYVMTDCDFVKDGFCVFGIKRVF